MSTSRTPLRRRRLVWVVAIALAASGAVNAQAFWASTDSGNHAAAVADALQQGATPTVDATGPDTVEIDFPRASTQHGREVTGYLVKRYDSPTSSPEIASFSCDWPSSTGLSCGEADVPDGTWYYSTTTTITGTQWAGTESARSAGVTVDTTAPDAPSAPDLAAWSDSGISDSDDLTNVTTPTFTGTAEAGTTVKILDGGVEVGQGVATGGVYGIQVSVLSEGVHTITATATDGQGNVSAASSGLTVTIDTTAPASPSTPDLAPGSDSGTSDSDNLTNVTTPTFTGTAEAGTTVKIFDGANQVGVEPAAGGSYSVTTSALGDGAHTITATASDPAGNSSPASSGLVVTIDTQAPAIPSTPDLAPGSDSGISDADNLTNDTTPTFAGTAEAGTTVRLFAGANQVGSGTATGGSYSVTVSTLAEGAHSITATATDAAGNASGATPALVVTIDTTVAAPSTPDLDPGSDSGSSDADNITNDTTPTFTGTAEDGALVTLFAGANQVGSTTATGGAYSITASTQAEGVHNMTARVTDAAGNLSPASGVLAVTVDTTAPVVTLSKIAKSPGYLDDFIKQGINYHVYANLTETGGGVASVTASVGSISTSGSPATLSAGSFSAEGMPYGFRSGSLTAASPLSPGAFSYSITSIDLAGNSNIQPSFGVTLENTAPTATNIQTANGGSTAGRAEANDTITLTFSEQIDPQSVLNGWTGTAGTGHIVVRLVDGGCVKILISLDCADDSLEFYNGANSALLPLGTVDLNHSGYNGSCGLLSCTLSDVYFGATGTPTTMAQSGNTITITLGTASTPGDGNSSTGSASTMAWSLTSGLYDAAGNGLTPATVNEGGSSDREF